jgi:hypothetical protein
MIRTHSRTLSRLAAGLISAATVLVLPHTLAGADPGHAGCFQDLGGHWVCTDLVDDPGPGQQGGGSTGSGSNQPTVYLWWTLDFRDLPGQLPDDPGLANGCWFIRIDQVSTDPPPPGHSAADALAALAEEGDNAVLWGRCPADPIVFDPAAAARAFWKSATLPAPARPRITPSPRQLVSLNTYLTIQVDTAPVVRLPNPIGADVFITPKAIYEIDWGDGTPPSQRADRGVPYSPGGDVPGQITHRYSTARTYQIKVTASWTATWTAGGARGELNDPIVNVAPDTPLQVIQAQAQTD